MFITDRELLNNHWGFSCYYNDVYIYLFENIGNNELVPMALYDPINGQICNTPILECGTGINPSPDLNLNFYTEDKNTTVTVSYLIKKNSKNMENNLMRFYINKLIIKKLI